MATMMNVFQYAAREEAAFRAQAQEIGYKPQTTFYNDLSIAEFCERYDNRFFILRNISATTRKNFLVV